jgi:HSP20 family protein
MVGIETKLTPKQPEWSTEEGREPGSVNFHYRLGTRSHKWHPPTDVYETEAAIIVRVEIAGMSDSEFSISLNDRDLTIQGIRPDYDDRLTFHQMEVRFGEFISEIKLNCPVDSQAVDADYKDGFLRVVLPKAGPHQVKIEV